MLNRHYLSYGLLVSIMVFIAPIKASDLINKTAIEKGELLYQTSMTDLSSVSDWHMEGPGKVEFNHGWMQMYSPDEAMHHVFWCPQDFPESFIAEWQVQNLSTKAGLVIIFFSALGVNGEDIFKHSLTKRNGTFDLYTKGDINNYHISYYANAAHNLDRPHANLRKNSGFNLVQEGQKGIPTKSTEPHKVQLVKDGKHILMRIDGRLIIDYIDKGDGGFPVLGAGKIGFRQMQWTKFQYKNFRVWSVK